MNKKGIRWLYRELPDLVSNGILSTENAEQLQRYYGDFEGNSRQRALLIFSILGALSIGLGIILLLAHNWKDLSRFVRTIISFIPLILAQLLTGWTIWRKKESIAVKEGVATFFILAIGSSIALISQTYHIPGNMANFLFSWMLLSAPIIYFMNSSVTVVLYLIGITAWAGYAQTEGRHALLFWPMAALIIPHFWQVLKKNLYGIRAIILSWTIALCLCAATGTVLEKALPGLWIITYSGLFAVMYLVGSLWFGEAPNIWQRPFHSVGAIGIYTLSLMLTYKWPWKKVGWNYYHSGGRIYEFAAISDYIITTILVIAAIFLIDTCIRRKQNLKLLFGVIPIVAFIGYLSSGSGTNIVFSTGLFNIYLFILGISIIVAGIRNGRLGTVNAGMVVLVSLITARFFDSNIGFVLRGILFIIVGIGFLTVNLVLMKRRGGTR